MRALTLLALAVMLTGAASAAVTVADASQLFEEANGIYLAGDLAQAIERYTDLLEAAPRSAVLHFNLGNAHARLGHLGWAVWCFERALLLRPGWDEARHNLALVQPAPPEAGTAIERAATWIRDGVPPHRWSWVAALGWATALLAAAGALVLEQPRWRRTLWRLTAASAVAMLLALAALALQHTERSARPPSIVVAPSATVRSGAGPSAGSVMGEVPEGTRVWQVGAPAATGWVKIRTASGQLTFIDQAALRPLDL